VVGTIQAVAVNRQIAASFSDLVNTHSLFVPDEGVTKPSLDSMIYLLVQTEQATAPVRAFAYPWVDFAASGSLEATQVVYIKLLDVTESALSSVYQHLNTLGVRHQTTVVAQS
jgi:hypothetical protein